MKKKRNIVTGKNLENFISDNCSESPFTVIPNQRNKYTASSKEPRSIGKIQTPRLLLAILVSNSHLAQNPGNGGRPISANIKAPNINTRSMFPRMPDQSEMFSFLTIPASQKSPALAMK